jgi:site-specific recombinase XerD
MLNRMIVQTQLLGAMGRRDRLIMRALFETDLTAHELIRIRRQDIDLRAKTFVVCGPRARRLRIERRLFDQIAFYRDEVAGFLGIEERHDRLFVYGFRTPFTLRQLRAMLEHYRRAAMIDDDACE